MFSIAQLKENLLNCMAQLEEELWKLSEQASQNRNLNQMGKVSSIMREQKKFADTIGYLFDEIAKVQIEPETNSANRAVRIICSRGGKSPTAIRIGEKEMRITKWNQIPETIANWILEDERNLPEIQNFISPSEEGFMKSAHLKRLNNGWFIEVGDDKKALIKKAEKLLRNADYPEEILVEAEDGSRNSVVSDMASDDRVKKLMKLYRKASPETQSKIKEVLGLH
jgi:hypothetical protein